MRVVAFIAALFSSIVPQLCLCHDLSTGAVAVEIICTCGQDGGADGSQDSDRVRRDGTSQASACVDVPLPAAGNAPGRDVSDALPASDVPAAASLSGALSFLAQAPSPRPAGQCRHGPFPLLI